jgi:nucleotide-binding universal stress UspA family protein
MIKHILVATDHSELSQKAVRGAIELAAATKATLVALHVVPHYPVAYFEGSIAMAPQDVARIEGQWSDKASTLLEAVRQQAHEAGIEAKAVVVKSDQVAEAIIAAAGKHHSDLIVMASHGRRGIGRILLGSETQHVLTHSTIPVLVLR